MDYIQTLLYSTVYGRNNRSIEGRSIINAEGKADGFKSRQNEIAPALRNYPACLSTPSAMR